MLPWQMLLWKLSRPQLTKEERKKSQTLTLGFLPSYAGTRLRCAGLSREEKGRMKFANATKSQQENPGEAKPTLSRPCPGSGQWGRGIVGRDLARFRGLSLENGSFDGPRSAFTGR